MQYKTADRLSRHLSAVMRKIREVIGNSLASKRPLLRSLSELAWDGELSSKTLRKYLDIHLTHTPRLHSWENVLLLCALYVSAPVLCGLPHPPAACFARHPIPSRAEIGYTHADTLRPLNDPSESPPSPSGKLGYAHLAQPAKLHRRDPSPTTVGQHCGNSGELCPYVYGSYGGRPVLNQAVDESSLTTSSIPKFQKIVNTIGEKLSIYED